MHKNKDNHKKRIFERLRMLSPGKQKAVLWLMENHEFAVELCSNSALTEEEWQKHMEIAQKKEDDMMLVLLQFSKWLQKDKAEGEDLKKRLSANFDRAEKPG